MHPGSRTGPANEKSDHRTTKKGPGNRVKHLKKLGYRVKDITQQGKTHDNEKNWFAIYIVHD